MGTQLIIMLSVSAVFLAAVGVWPWLAQLGYGKGGWHSYDWIDNDFQPGAYRIVPEYQNLKVGDKSLMMPEVGFVVQSIDAPQSIVSVFEDGSTSWCLALYPNNGGLD